MTEHRSAPDRVAAELASLTGRTETEVKVVVAAAVVVAAVTLVFRTVKALVDLELSHAARPRRH